MKVDGAQSFQELIGQNHWAVKIGRIDIVMETSLQSSYRAMPHIGHLDQELYICRKLKSYLKSKLGFDRAHPAINDNRFQDCYWAEFYQYASEAIPGNKSVPRGNFMSTQ